VSPVYTQGRLTSIPGFANAITYHPNGMVYQVTHANGVTDTQANDPNGMARPSALSAQNAAGTVWSSGTYAYDGVGNVNKVGNSYFLYDHVSRLVDGHAYDGPTGAGNLRSQTYTYDPLGNLTAVGGDAWAAGRAIPTAAASNRLTGGTYDTAGNLVAWNGNSYEYDALGKMTRMLAGAEDWRYTYTAGDERLFEFRTAGGGANWALRDLNGKVLREFQEQYAWNPREYVYRDGQLLASSFYTEGVRHFHLDHLGTPRAITDANGNRVAYHAYFPFGEEMTSFAQDSEQMKLTGHERDFANASSVADDLDYMHARHYNPQVGRFLSIDPLFRPTSGPQGLNRYSYVGGRPLTLVDRYGLDPCFTDDSGTFRCDTTTTTTPIFLDPLQGLSDLIGGRLFMDSFPFDSWSNIRDGFWQGIKIAEQLALHCDQSYGVAIDLSTLNPFTGGGGSIDGWNVQYVPGHGVGLYSYSTPADFGSAGFDLGLSLTMNTAIGEGNWTGDFLTGVGSVGDVAFGAFGSPANPSELGWHGLQAGGSLGLPLGVGLTDTNYKQRRDLSFMRWWCH
jgi:RHS repeat-associated protein